MKSLIGITVLGGLALAACSQNDKPQNTAPADYAETEQKLIQNREKDSLRGDSLDAATSMPPQQVTGENPNQSELKE